MALLTLVVYKHVSAAHLSCNVRFLRRHSVIAECPTSKLNTKNKWVETKSFHTFLSPWRSNIYTNALLWTCLVNEKASWVSVLWSCGGHRQVRALSQWHARAVRERDPSLIGFRGLIYSSYAKCIKHDVSLPTRPLWVVTSSCCHTVILHSPCSYNKS